MWTMISTNVSMCEGLRYHFVFSLDGMKRKKTLMQYVMLHYLQMRTIIHVIIAVIHIIDFNNYNSAPHQIRLLLYVLSLSFEFFIYSHSHIFLFCF